MAFESQVQLTQAAEAQRLNSLQPTSTGFNLGLSGITSATDLSNAAQEPFTSQDTSSLLSNLRAQQLKVAELLKPSQRELQLQQQLAGLQTGEEFGIAKLETQAIPLGLISGQQAALSRVAGAKQAGIQRELGLVQQERQGELEGQKFLANVAQQQLQLVEQRELRVQQQANILRDDARQALNTILTNFGGLAFEDLDQATQLQVRQLAKNVGLPEGLLRQGMQTIKEKNLALAQQKQAELQQQRDIQNQIALARLEIAQSNAGKGTTKITDEIENVDLYKSSLIQAMEGGATPEQAVFAASAIAKNLGSELTKKQQNALLKISQEYIKYKQSNTPVSAPVEQKPAGGIVPVVKKASSAVGGFFKGLFGK